MNAFSERLQSVLKKAQAGKLLFVYGSLVRKHHNHGQMRGATFVRIAKTAPRYSLRNLGGFAGLARVGSQTVRGELYYVPDAILKKLDNFEMKIYKRQPIKLTNGTVADAFVLKQARGKEVQGGQWSEPKKKST